ncbi:M91 family zinc metallopeptidase [Nocardioides sp.]|uniref:M91 family zinc metallopeptidase n=1 Tax=Nocardioides sp. TaxID=35761 RepID=UPI001A1A8EAC|nr:M91 family zinc metallopeptidase [Nocardioides sp.]MBJ7358594.1 hypothetical protein [Nocardioides sp.]
MTAGLWTLRHDAAALEQAATSWTGAGAALAATVDDVNAAALAVLGAGWEGDSADGYDAHRRRLVADVDRGTALADRAAGVLRAAAGSIRAAESRLQGAWARVAGVAHTVAGREVVFRPADDAERLLVEEARDEAVGIRSGLDAALVGDLAGLDDLAREWTALAGRWADAAAGAPSFELPEDTDRTGILVVDGVVVVNTGGGVDDVVVSRDPATGEVLVDVDGVYHRFPEGTEVEIRTGTGDDSVTVDPGIRDGVTVLAGEGADEVHGGAGGDTIVAGTGHDVVTGGDAHDHLFGNAGQDYLDGQDAGDLVDGGQGDDTVYGLGGADTLAGGEGDDYIEGGLGDDEILGGSGADVLSGGAGDDHLAGGADPDVAYGGTGADAVVGGSGHDTSYAQPTGAVDLDDYVTIEGSPEFEARVRADLALLAASPNGHELLAGILDGLEEGDDGTVVIREHQPGDPDRAFLDPTGAEGPDYVLGYDPTYDDLRGHTPPSVVLGHELAHLWDHVTGHADDLDGETAGVDNGELAATGLPIDHDDDPGTPAVIDPEHPVEITENGLRDEMGLPGRDDYER